MGSHIFGFLEVRLFVIFTVSKRTRMFLLQTESKVVSFNLKKWVISQREMVLSPNYEEVASSEKNIPRPNWSKLIPFFRPKKIKNHTLWRRTHLYSRYKGLPPPPPPPSRATITIHLCIYKCLMGLRYSCFLTTTVLTNKRHMSRRICTENFHNLFIQNKN